MKISGLRLLVLPRLLVFFSVGVEAAQRWGAPPKNESLRKGETRATFDPGQFSDACVKPSIISSEFAQNGLKKNSSYVFS